MPAAPNLFTIPASVPFLPALIAALTGKAPFEDFPTAQDPLALAAVTLFLPTRRACRLAREVFIEVLGTNAVLLPRIVAIGDIDEDEIVFSQMAAGALAADALALPDDIKPLERQLLLSTYILKWTAGIKPDTGAPLVAHTPSAALSLATDLGRLIDDVTTRQVSWDKFDALVPQQHDKYWELTLDFLKIARQTWPAVLKERGEIDATQRRDLLIEAETHRLKAHGGGPVIAAGSTGSMPSTAKLLATIASLPQGAVVLPGLDTDLDEASWRLIGHDEEGPAAGHPQFALAALLERMGVTRNDVRRMGTPTAGRERLVSEALRPAAATEHWRQELEADAFKAHADAAISSLAVIEAAHSEDEALAIAIALRETVDDGSPDGTDRTAALITPDRALARRVLAALTRWQVPVDDSGGGPLTETAAGIFARLAAECALGGVEPVTLLALLKHPLCGLMLPNHTLAGAVSALERAILRGPRPRKGTDGLLHALATFDALRKEPEGLHYRDPRARLGDDEFSAAQALVFALKEALAPLEGVTGQSARLSDMAARHLAVIAALTGAAGGDALPIAERDGGPALTQLLADLAASETAASLDITPKDYREIFQTIAAGKVVRRPGAPGARVRIYGPLEARLQQADRVILGGLNEGTWPPDTRNDPWLSRPMRRELGLDLPERRVGLSAHDFAQALGAPDVILTRAAKVTGAPTVASRFLQRLAAVAGETRWESAKARGAAYLAWAHALDRPEAIVPAPRPAPTPAIGLRPKRLSVTEIEHWLRDPYTIYARHILKLSALDPVDAAPGARDRGTLIHEAIGNFTKEFAGALPASPLDELLALGRSAFAPLMGYPQARAFWWPRFKRIAQWFVTWDAGRRANVSVLHIEIDGKIDVTPDFALSARADRIEQLNDGRYAVLDFKTGRPPSLPEVATGLAPQLTLEAAILREGGFAGIPPKSQIAELAYVRVSGGQKPGEFVSREPKNGSPDEAADKALARLREVALTFAQEKTPYLSFARPQWVGRTYSDYDHLARVKEWSATGGEPDESIPDL